jgi:drug/metabolite transporter (DMT)-like permease
MFSPPLRLPEPCNVPPASANDAVGRARLMLVAVSLAWGLSWAAMKFALDEIPPFSMRMGTSGLATVALLTLAFMQRRTVRVRGATVWAHLVVAGCLNIAGFTLFTAFAQITTATSRVAILTYTMPIWAALLAYPVLGERLSVSRGMSLLLCTVGLAVLIYPLIGSSDLIGLVFALASAVSWAMGTVYLKWARIEADPIAVAIWQLIVGFLVTVAGVLIVEGSPHLWPSQPRAGWGRVVSALFGSAFA